MAIKPEPPHGRPSASGDPAGRPDEHSPFVFDVRGLGREPGRMEAVHRTVRSPARYGLDLIAIPSGAPIDIDVRLESVVEGVLVSGTVSAHAEGECSRCLRPVDEPLELRLTELFAFPGSAAEQTSQDDETGSVVEDLVDIEQAIVDGVGLSLPLQPLCREDCPGLCPVCGIDLAIADPDHGHDTMDPRWAGLADKLDELSGRSPSAAPNPGGEGSQDRTKNTDHRSEEN